MIHKESINEILDLGTRKVGNMHFSKIVTLPKTFTDNYLDKNRTVQMVLRLDGVLLLIPVLSKTSNSGNRKKDIKAEEIGN
jgi:hypothetical protein